MTEEQELSKDELPEELRAALRAQGIDLDNPDLHVIAVPLGGENPIKQMRKFLMMAELSGIDVDEARAKLMIGMEQAGEPVHHRLYTLLLTAHLDDADPLETCKAFLMGMQAAVYNPDWAAGVVQSLEDAIADDGKDARDGSKALSELTPVNPDRDGDGGAESEPLPDVFSWLPAYLDEQFK